MTAPYASLVHPPLPPQVKYTGQALSHYIADGICNALMSGDGGSFQFVVVGHRHGRSANPAYGGVEPIKRLLHHERSHLGAETILGPSLVGNDEPMGFSDGR